MEHTNDGHDEFDAGLDLAWDASIVETPYDPLPSAPNGVAPELCEIVQESSLSSLEFQQLEDAGRQIRLLQVSQPSRKLWQSKPTFVPISVSTSVWRLEQAPAYAAISYTWGPPLPRAEISLNGWHTTVTENCRYALSQLPYGHYKYYWMDALCINQSNSGEKSAQVQMMGLIYERAAVVLASIGSCAPHTTYMFDKMNVLLAKLKRDPEKALPAVDEFYHDDRATFALQALSDRKYWHRLWIMQELLLATQVIVCCGSHRIDFRDFTICWQALKKADELKNLDIKYVRRGSATASSTWAKLWGRHDLPGRATNTKGLRLEWTELNRLPKSLPGIHSSPMARLMEATVTSGNSFGPAGGRTANMEPSFAELLQNSTNAKCHDPRDRIFGILSLVEWPHGLPPLEPDYTLSTIGLAAMAVSYCDSHDPSEVLNYLSVLRTALNITPYEEAVADMISTRRKRYATSDVQAEHSLRTIPTPAGLRKRSITESWFTQTCRIRGVGSKLQVNTLEAFAAGGRLDLPVERYIKTGLGLPLMVGSSVAAIVPPQTKIGDILILNATDHSPIGFVISEVQSCQIYFVVGRAVILPDWQCITGFAIEGKPHSPSDRPILELHLSDEDLLILSIHMEHTEHWLKQLIDFSDLDLSFCSTDFSSYARAKVKRKHARE